MSKVFIAWSGNLELAKAVAAEIYSRSNEYECIIGGDSQGKENIFVGETIIAQMRECDKAILLVQKKSDVGLSHNLMFEWGFLLSALNAKRTNVYFIDISSTDEVFPSDVQGVWSKSSFDTAKHTMTEIAEMICEDFLGRQKIVIEGNKTNHILNWYKTRNMIAGHLQNPTCSDYELAQYVMLYTYSAKFFEKLLPTVETDIEQLSRSTSLFYSDELRIAVCGARAILKLLKSIKVQAGSKGMDALYLEERDYSEVVDVFETICRNIEGLEDSEPRRLFEVLIGNCVVFSHLLMMYNRNPAEADPIYYADLLLEKSESLIPACLELDRMNTKDNSQLSWIMLAYTYRSVYCALVEKKKEGAAVDPEEERRYLALTLEYREKLYSYYNGGNINGEFFDNIEMEYFLSLAEYLRYEENKLEQSRAVRKLNKYIEKAQIISKNKRVCVDIISEQLSSLI